ncbi:hypothetical protein ABZP36_004385 [Zizania latifolia]
MASERTSMDVNKRGLMLWELLQQTGHYNVFNNFLAVLSNDRIHLQDKSKLNSVLSGLGHCLSQVSNATENGDASNRLVHSFSVRELWKCTLNEDNSGSTFVMSNILMKLQNLIQILVNSVEVSASELCAKPTIDAQSSEALLPSLSCLDLICKICIHEAKKPQMKFGRSKTQVAPEWLESSMLVYLKKLWGVSRSFHEKGDDRYYVFNLKIAEFFLCLNACVDNIFFPAEEFCQFVSSLLAKEKTFLNKDIMEKHLSPLITSIPDLVSNARDDSKGSLLEAFTDAFRDCKVDCKLILPYLDAVGKMLLPVDELPGILLQSIDKAPSVTKVVLELLLRIGQYFPTMECGNLRSFIRLFGVKSSSGTVELGPFVNLPHYCQELAISCLYYFSSLLPDTIEPLASCCLSDVLEPTVLLRIVEVLQSAYKAGNLHITEQLSFLSLLMARFRVHPGPFCTQEDSRKRSNLNTYKSLNHLILTCLSEMGDGSLVLELMWDNLYKEIAQKLPLHNMNGLFRIMVTLMNDYAIKIIAGYMVDAAMDLSKSIELGFQSDRTRLFQYFLKPCIIIFCQNDKVLCCTLEMLKSFATGDDHWLSSVPKFGYPGELSHRICVVVTILIFLCNDRKLHKNLSLGKLVIRGILRHIRQLMDSNVPDVTYEDKQKLRFAFEQLKAKALQLNYWDRSELEEFSSTT